MRITTLDGEVVQAQTPRWEPLEDAVGDLAAWFMWMLQIRLEDGTRIDAYKHVWTRRYLHIDGDGRAFRFCAPGGYRLSELSVEIANTFVGWESGEPSAEDVALLDAVLRDVRELRELVGAFLSLLGSATTRRVPNGTAWKKFGAWHPRSAGVKAAT